MKRFLPSIDRGLDRTLWMVAVLVVAVLIINARMVYSNVRELQNNEELVAHTLMVLQSLDGIVLLAEQAQNNQRGYVITGQTQFLDRYREVAPALNIQRMKLEKLVADNPLQTQRLSGLKQDLAARLQHFDDLITLYKTSGINGVRTAMIKFESGKAAAKLNEDLQAMIGEEKNLLETRSEHFKHTYNVALFTSLFAGYAGLIIFGALIYSMRRNLIARDQFAGILYQQANELARSNRELEEFAYIASHDLQEPLNVINSFTDLLSRRSAPKLDTKEKEYLGFIKQGSRQARMLIKELLEYSRIGLNKNHDSVNMDKVLEEVVHNLQVVVEKSGAVIQYQGLLPVKGEHMAMVQLFQNLITNSIKYRSHESPRIKITSRLDHHMCLFAVKDNGIGIDPQFKDKIFGMFQRLHSKSEYSGTGIGLAICKKIIENHGGQIWVDSRLGHGATFYFTLRPG